MTDIEQRYQRAEQFLPWNLAPRCNNISLQPHWLDEYRFWFKRDLEQGHEFVLVDSECLTETPVFDHQRLALALTELLDQTVSSQQLPIETLEFDGDDQLSFFLSPNTAQGQRVLLNLETYVCTIDGEKLEGKKTSATIDEHDALPSVISPDGQSGVICRGDNIFLRELSSGAEKALTEDGEPHYGYGTYSDFQRACIAENNPPAPAVLWSPDGRYLAVQRIDERQVKTMPMVQSVPTDDSFRPINRSYKMALPGDTHIGLSALCVIDLEAGDVIESDREPMPAYIYGPMDSGAAVWGTDNCLYYIVSTRDRQTYQLVSFNPALGISRTLVEDTGQGIMAPSPLPLIGYPIFKVLPEIGEFIWYSQRTGWGHLYRYDLTTGELKNPITSGDYVVTRIHHIDRVKGELYFTACGREPNRNPYYDHLYRVSLDGSDLILLTPEASHHDIVPSDFEPDDSSFSSNTFNAIKSVSPSGKFFVDTISRVDQPSRSLLRSCVDGAELMTLATCDETLLPEMLAPQSFTVKAADNTTDLWGVSYRPSDFDESKRYPVILFIYGAPQTCLTQKKFAEAAARVNMGFIQAIAELGFIIVTLDPRGTPLRSKTFSDVAYGNLQSGGGIDDQVAAIKQLGKRYPWMDLDRVGISGFSGGGFASARAMFSHPDFFKVAVSWSGSHDQRLYIASWGETFQGLLAGDNYEEQACVSLAQNLTGKLLLIHGEMDANVHIAHTLQLVNQLIAHNKDFDLLILPNRKHVYYFDPYFIRRLWDYFVEHLLKRTPPKNYCITAPQDSSTN